MCPKRTVEIIPVSEPEHRDGIVGSEAKSKAGSGPELGRDRRIVNSAWLGPMRRSRPTARCFAKNPPPHCHHHALALTARKPIHTG